MRERCTGERGAAAFSWQRLGGVYEAPESDALLGLMAPVSGQATSIGDNLGVVSAALARFAAEVRPIKAALDALRDEAVTFRDSIANGVSVLEPDSVSFTPGGYYPSAGAAAGSSPGYRRVTREWHGLQEYVDRNNDLIARVNAQQVALWDAERNCANTIRELFGGRPLRSLDSGESRRGYGVSEIPSDAAMPWGAPVTRTEGCGEAATTFVLEDVLWEGVLVGGVWGSIEGLLTLVAGFDPATGEFFSADAYGAAWSGLGMLGAGVLIATSPPLSLIKAADDTAALFGGQVLPAEARGVTNAIDETWLNAGRSLIAWDKWSEDPGAALGESLFNVATFLVPASAAVAGMKATGAAATVLPKIARVVDALDPSALALEGAVRLSNLGLSRISTLGDAVSGGGPVDARTGTTTVVPDAATAIARLAEMGDELTAGIRAHNGAPVVEFPGGVIEIRDTVGSHHGSRSPRLSHDPPPLPYDTFARINDEYRLRTGEVDPSRLDEWAQAMSEAYPLLTPEEVKGVYFYTTEKGHAAAVRLLREGDERGIDIDTKMRIRNAQGGLAKLPPWQGKSFRGVGLPAELPGNFVVGERWSDPSFVSTSSESAVAVDFAEAARARGFAPAVISIEGRTGSDVSPFSRYQGEWEITFGEGTEFEVLSAHWDPQELWLIRLREVEREP